MKYRSKPEPQTRTPFQQNPNTCRHDFLFLQANDKGTALFYCQRCLHFETRQLPEGFEPQQEVSPEIAPRLGGDALADI